ncbi:MAG: DUF721 domain-containing protein [Pseudomonadota bacterium]|nr:DUF721 domain-containing protein [Pseudomonadota bacterium]
MRQKNTVSCCQILDNARLPLLERARKLQRLEQAVLGLLPEDVAAHCRVMNLKNKILVLAAPSSAWAARLRFAGPELVRQLNGQFALNLHTIQLRIQPQTSEKQSVRQHQLNLSMASGTLLAQTAQTVNHPALREALYRLAAKARDY